MQRLCFLHLVVLAVPLVSASTESPIANGGSIFSTNFSTTQHAMLLNSMTPIVHPNSQTVDTLTESSSIPNTKSFISLGPLQILGHLVKSSHRNNPTSSQFDPTLPQPQRVHISPTLNAYTSSMHRLAKDMMPDKNTDPEMINPYAYWDTDSEEQESELHPSLKEGSVNEEMKLPPAASSTTTTSRSYLLLLAGNATVVRLRQKDFAKYLKLNLAARLSLEYDDVQVNRVVLTPPQLVVNVSVVTPEAYSSERNIVEGSDGDSTQKEDAPLHMLADTNATLLELSGEEYHVVRLLPLRSNNRVDDGTEVPPLPPSEYFDAEFIIYVLLGGICLTVLVATLLRLLKQRYKNHSSISWILPKSYLPWGPSQFQRDKLPNNNSRHEIATTPTVIYSGTFGIRAATSQPYWVQNDYQPHPVCTASNIAELKSPFSIDVSSHNQSPRKLHIFSCRPGSVVIPLPYQHQTDNLQHCLGHDNPNYQS